MLAASGDWKRWITKMRSWLCGKDASSVVGREHSFIVIRTNGGVHSVPSPDRLKRAQFVLNGMWISPSVIPKILRRKLRIPVSRSHTVVSALASCLLLVHSVLSGAPCHQHEFLCKTCALFCCNADVSRTTTSLCMHFERFVAFDGAYMSFAVKHIVFLIHETKNVQMYRRQVIHL